MSTLGPVGKISAPSQNKRNENPGKEAKEESHKYASGRGRPSSSKPAKMRPAGCLQRLSCQRLPCPTSEKREHRREKAQLPHQTFPPCPLPKSFKSLQTVGKSRSSQSQTDVGWNPNSAAQGLGPCASDLSLLGLSFFMCSRG